MSQSVSTTGRQGSAPSRRLLPPPFPGFIGRTVRLAVDGATAYVGSANWDARSARLNFEVGVVVREAALCASLGALFERRAASGRPVTEETLQLGIPARIATGICRLLSPLL